MKVGILTFEWAINYGAVLQAYALYKTLRNLGHRPLFLQYLPESMRSAANPGWGLRRFHPFETWLMRRRFTDFRKERLGESVPFVMSDVELQSVCADLDAIIVGSDQVWNHRLLGCHDAKYFLADPMFAAKRKVSYAACCGSPKQSADVFQRISEMASRFDFLSVRGDFNRKLLSDHGPAKPLSVCDPVFLNSFDELLVPKKQQDAFILLAGIQPMHADLLEGARIVGEQLGLPVVGAGIRDLPDVCSQRIFSAGPAEWLNLMSSAKYVITDSFHATAFALKFQKPFSFVPTGVDPSRIVELLKPFGLENRIHPMGTPFDRKSVKFDGYSWETVESHIESQKQTGIAFLRESLE